MPRAEILDRSPVEILLDHRRAHIGAAGNSGRIAELVSDATHHRRNHTLGLTLRFRRPTLGKGNRGDQRPAPGAEVLRRELVAEVFTDVVVEAGPGEAADTALALVPAQPPSSGECEQLLDRLGQLLVDQRGPHDRAVLAAKVEGDLLAAGLDMSLAQSRDPIGARLLRVALRADAKPAGIDQAHCDRGDAQTIERVVLHVLCHREAKVGQSFGEADQLVELRLLLLRTKCRVVQVLPAAGRVDTCRLQLRARTGRDPDVFPRGRDHESANAFELLLIGDRASARVEIAEAPARTHACPAPFPRHAPPLVSADVHVKTIVVLEGDETGQELLEEALRVLAADVIGFELDFPRFDLSLEQRRATKNQVVHEAAQAIREHGLGLKAATITPEGRADVGSPNRILREEIGGRVIVRTGRRIPGVIPLGGVHAPISIVRMAVGDAYGAKEWREGEGDDEVAFRTERIERRICRAVAEFSFRHAEQAGAKVFGGPKYTVSPTYEGLLKEEMDAAAERHPGVV